MSRPAPGLEFVAHVEVDLGDPMVVGGVAEGVRRVVPIVGGTFDGPRLRGVIVDNGADWQVVQPDGTIRIDTRYTWRCDDGALVYARTRGYRTGAPDVLRRLAGGEPVEPAEYYFRVTADLETGAEDHAWVNTRIFVADAARQANRVVYDLWEVC